MNILWHIGVLALFPWFAVLAGMLPVVILYRVRMIVNKNNKTRHSILNKTDMFSLLLFDLGIFGVAVWLFTLVMTTVRVGAYDHHDWFGLLIVHFFMACFAIGMILRKRQLKMSASLTKTFMDEAEKL